MSITEALPVLPPSAPPPSAPPPPDSVVLSDWVSALLELSSEPPQAASAREARTRARTTRRAFFMVGSFRESGGLSIGRYGGAPERVHQAVVGYLPVNSGFSPP